MSLKQLTNVLIRVFAREFYRMNSGFFLLTGTLAFGFMSSVEHIALAEFFVSSFPSLTIPLAAWLLYLIKILHFNTNLLHLEDARFVYNVQFLPGSQQIIASGAVLSIQLLPAIVYGAFLILTAWKISTFQSIWIVAIFLAAMCISASVFMVRSFQNPGREKRTTIIKRLLDRHYVKPLIQFYTEWLLRKDPFMIAATKLLTGGLLYGICMLYRHEAYDWRLIAMATTACGVANLLIIFHLVNFDPLYVAWMKNMPLTLLKRYAQFLTVLTIFLIPEAVVLIRNFPEHLGAGWMILIILYALGLCAFFLGFLHTGDSGLEYFTRQTFWIFTALILAVLFKVPLILLTLSAFVGGWVLFRRNYYLHEPAKR